MAHRTAWCCLSSECRHSPNIEAQKIEGLTCRNFTQSHNVADCRNMLRIGTATLYLPPKCVQCLLQEAEVDSAAFPNKFEYTELRNLDADILSSKKCTVFDVLNEFPAPYGTSL